MARQNRCDAIDESTVGVYQLVERAKLLGWSRERVDVIDDDLGVSGRSVEGRPGFQRLNAAPLHELVERQLLLSLSAASIDLSLAAASDIEADRAKVAKHHT